MENLFDVAIIGGGIIGTSVAYRLSHFQVSTVLLEKEMDVCAGVSKSNSGIVHGGFHYSATNTLKGRLELQGNLAFDRLHSELGFPFQRCGILVAAFTEEQLDTVKKLYQQGVSNGVPGIELCDAARMRELEPKLNPAVLGGLHAPGGGVVEPYCMVFALMETACLNGVCLLKQFQVTSAKEADNLWEITSADGRCLRARYVINAAGLHADDVSRIFDAEEFRILPRKGEEYLLDRLSAARPEKVIFPVPSGHTKGVLVIPTAGGTTMIGPTADIVEDKEDTSTTAINKERIFSLAKGMVSGVSERDLITSFSGSRPVMEGREDFFILRSEKAPRLIQAAGIQSPGLTASPAIAEYVTGLLQEAGLALAEKQEPYKLPVKRAPLRDVSLEEADRRHAEDPAWTHIVCRCEKVSEAEIRSAVRRGHDTVEGVKMATRAGMGRCQSGFCSLKIMHIIASELGISLEEVMRRESEGTAQITTLGVTSDEESRI